MKQLFLIGVLSLLGSPLFAQDDSNDVSMSVPAADSADFHYGNVSEAKPAVFKVNREKIAFHRVYQVNTAKDADEVYERALGYARMMNVDHKGNKNKRSITMPITWSYSGGMNECIEALQLQGTLLIEVKDLKTRITLKDINYVHHDRDDDHVKPVAKSDLLSKHLDCAPAQGKVELLYNCTACQQSIKSVDSQLESQFDFFANQYQERLKKY
jgi:hypothetical protein